MLMEKANAICSLEVLLLTDAVYFFRSFRQSRPCSLLDEAIAQKKKVRFGYLHYGLKKTARVKELYAQPLRNGLHE